MNTKFIAACLTVFTLTVSAPLKANAWGFEDLFGGSSRNDQYQPNFGNNGQIFPTDRRSDNHNNSCLSMFMCDVPGNNPSRSNSWDNNPKGDTLRTGGSDQGWWNMFKW